MKKTLFILISVLCLSCCGVKESQEENLKTISDLRARIVMIHYNDSLVVAVQDSLLRECGCFQPAK